MTLRIDARQSRQRAKLDQISTTTDIRLDAILNLMNDELTMPLRMRAADVDDSEKNLYIDSISVVTEDAAATDAGHGRKRTLPPIDGLLPSYSGGGSIAFPAATGGSIVGTGLTLADSYTLTIGADQYKKIIVWFNGDGKFGFEFGQDAASEAAALVPEPPTDAFSLGYIVVRDVGGVVQNISNGNIVQFVGGGGSGGGSGASKSVSQANSFVPGDVVYFNGTAYVKANAAASSTAEAIGVVSKADANKFTVVELGFIKTLSGLTPGSVYFLSDVTDGLLTENEPTVVGSVSKPMLLAVSSTEGYVLNYRGIVVGAANARTQISLPQGSSQDVQDFAAYDAAKLDGYVYIDGSTDYRFYVEAQVSKNGAGDDYNLSYQTSGDTPPVGFDVAISSAGMLSITLPSIAGFVSSYINYALNAPAVGTSFPLSIDASAVTGGTLSSDRLPKSTLADATQQYLVPDIRVSGEGDLGAIAGWTTIGSKKYRWYVVGKICFYEHRVESPTASNATNVLYVNLPADVPKPKNFSNQSDTEWVVAAYGARTDVLNGGLTTTAGSGVFRLSATEFRVYTYTATSQGTRLWTFSAMWQID